MSKTIDDYTEKRLELLEHITEQHNTIDITRISYYCYDQIKKLLVESINQAELKGYKRGKEEVK